MLLAALAAAAIAVSLSGPAIASHIRMDATMPDELVLGQTINVPVVLQSRDGAPLEGATVVFFLHAVFAGTEGEAEVGRAVTDERGMAVLAYRPRLVGHHELRMQYAALGDAEAEVVTVVFDVNGGEQLYRSAPGVDVPGLNVGLLMAALGAVWSILLWVAIRLIRIAAAGRTPDVAGQSPVQ
jgi:hypothetical protein